MSTGTLRRWCLPSSVRATGVRCSVCHIEIICGVKSDGPHVGFAWLACNCTSTFRSYPLSGGSCFDGELESKRAWSDAARSLLSQQKAGNP